MGSNKIIALMRLLETSESKFSIGTFSFTNGLERASDVNLIANENTLQQYVLAASRQAAYSDSIAAIQAYRAAADDDYDRILLADQEVYHCKANEEARRFTCRLGRRLACESREIMDCPMLDRFINDIRRGKTPGTYPIVQAMLMFHAGLSEMEMFCSQQFGIITMILSAALKSVTAPEVDARRIACNLAPQAALDYKIIKQLDFSDMKPLMPDEELHSSFVRRGTMVMSMN